MSIHKVIFICLFFFGAAPVFAQFSDTKDSLLHHHIHQLSQKFALLQEQEKFWFELGLDHQKKLDSVNAAALSLEARKAALQSVLQLHDAALQTLMAKEQWSAYQAFVAQLRESFLKNAEEKKIAVSEVPRQIP